MVSAWLSDMCPSASIAGKPDGSLTNPEYFAQSWGAELRVASNVSDIMLSQLGIGTVFPTNVIGSPSSATLGVHVSDIVSSRSKEQVIGAAALPVVTNVENAEVIWDWPVGEFPCDAMSISDTLAGDACLSVAGRLATHLPLPAPIAGTVNLRPESFLERSMIAGHRIHLSSGAIPRLLHQRGDTFYAGMIHQR